MLMLIVGLVRHLGDIDEGEGRAATVETVTNGEVGERIRASFGV
jgi:hypothetical protein